MELESYFDFLPDGDIRIKGTRVYLEDVIRQYHEGYSPEEINSHLPSVEVEQAYATILYYLANRAEMDEYIRRLRAEADAKYQEYQKNPSELQLSLRKRKEALLKQRLEAAQVSDYQEVKP